MLVYLKWGFGIDFVIVCAALSILLALALIDLEHGLILNRIVYPSLVAFLILSPFWSELESSRSFLGNEDMLASALNSLVAGLGGFLFFFFIALAYPSGMGGGDVKLAGLIGLMVGLPGVIVALWVAVVSGGVVAAALLLSGKKGRKDAIPFGPFLSMGAIVALLAGSNIVSGYEALADDVAAVL